MHDLAIVTTITSIEPIAGKDRIVKATVENYNCIITKEYNVGDRVVYVFYDSILPDDNPDFEFLRTRCWSRKYHGYRIRPMKMGGIISEGLVLPLSVLPGGKEYNLGDIVTEDLRIRPYIPPEDFGPGKKIGPYPIRVPKSDEENIERVWENYPIWKDSEFYVTEKVEGAAGTWIYKTEDDSFHVFSHNWEVDEGVWLDAAVNNSLADKMKGYCLSHGRGNLVLQGEVIAPGLQKNIYHVSRPDIYIYGMMSLDGERYSYKEMKEACEEMCVKMVPVIRESAYMPSTLDELLMESVGKSVIDPLSPREGLVWRATRKGSDIHFKVKSRPYKVWFEEH